MARTLALWGCAILLGASALPRHGLFGAVLADKPAGVTVTRVISGSAAAAAGLQLGDVIVRIADVPTHDVAGTLAAMHALHAGQRITVAIARAGKDLDLTAVLGAPPDETDPNVTTAYDAVSVDGSLRRTLVTAPAGATGRLPAVLLIGGIGCFSIDVASNTQDPYLRLAHDLSRNGVVTMRLEKSGVGDSQGPPCRTVDFDSEAHSYAVALAALRADPHVDPSRVYLFGHSSGSIIAPLLASRTPVAGIVVAEAIGRDWFEYELRNARRQIELGGASAAETDAGVMDKYVCMYRLLVQKEPESQIEADRPACSDANGVYPVDPPYLQQLAALNVIALWSKIAVPVLAVYGSSDFVTEREDHQRIVAVLHAARPASASFHEIEGMDHLLLRAASPKAALDAYLNGIPRQYDTDLSTTIVQWLRAHSRS